jgi:DNA-binding HxlR family transcriptional regulator
VSHEEALASGRSELELIAHVDETLAVLHGKWKVHLMVFMARGVHRHGRLLACIACMPGVSKKVMTDTLRALERDGLVSRRIFAEVPVRVEYSLSRLRPVEP